MRYKKIIKLDNQIIVDLNQVISIVADEIHVSKYHIRLYLKGCNNVRINKENFILKYISTLSDGTKSYDLEVKINNGL